MGLLTPPPDLAEPEATLEAAPGRPLPRALGPVPAPKRVLAGALLASDPSDPCFAPPAEQSWLTALVEPARVRFGETVGGHLPHAVGAAWALRPGRAAAVFALVDAPSLGTTGLHDALNFAAVLAAPVIFLAECPLDEGIAWGLAYGLRVGRLGADPEAAYATTREARGEVLGAGPVLLTVP